MSTEKCGIDLRTRVAEAIYRTSLDQATQEINKKTLVLSDVENAFLEAYEANDRACAIIIFALADQLLIDIFSCHLIKPSKEFHSKILGDNGILPTASSRITMTYALAWITPNTYHDLNLMRKIRNRFAHEMKAKTFSDHAMSGLLSSFKVSSRVTLINILALVFDNQNERKEKHNYLLEEYHKKGKFFFCLNSAFMIEDMVLQALVSPIALSMRVHPHDIISTWHDDGILKEIRMTFSKAITDVLGQLIPEFRET